MGKPAKFDMGAFAQSLAQDTPAPPAAQRDIETITGEILTLKQDAGNAILGIGQRLIEAKAMLSHGEWTPWLEEQVEFSERSARNFMKLAREWTNRQTLAVLGASKALTLLALPPEERDVFIEESHVVNGEEKRVQDMSARELRKALRERDKAHREAEAEIRALKALQESAQDGEIRARDALAKAREELQAVRDKPVEVAVQTVVDEEAVKKARADAIAEMEAKVARAEGLRRDAEKKRKEAETALAAAKKQADVINASALSRAEQAERELAEARRQLEAVENTGKTSAVNATPDLAMFNVLFNQAQEIVNKMHGLRLKIGKDDETLDPKLKAAINALADAVRRCAE